MRQPHLLILPIATQLRRMETAQLDTAQVKFGTASLLLDGVNGSYAAVTGNINDFAFPGDFTIDASVRPTTFGSGGFYIFHSDQSQSVTNRYALSVTTLGEVGWAINGGGVFFSPTGAVQLNADNHIAITRSGNTTTVFVNGISQGTYTGTESLATGTEVHVGASGFGTFALNGWIDEYRVIKGYAAWTSNFSPPTRAYSSSDITAGNLSTFAVLGQAAAVTLSGVGNVSVDASVIPASGVQYQIASTFAGAGNLRAYLAQGNIATVTFASNGNLSADSRRFSQVSATFAGAGNLSAYVVQQNAAAAIFGGIGNLNAFATITGAVNAWSGAATFAGAGAVSASATQNQRAAAFFIGAGNLNAYVSQLNIATATYSGLGNLSALTKITSQLSAIFAGTGNVSVNAGSAQQVQARFSGIGNFTSFGTITGAVNVWSAEARFVASGNLSASTISAQQALTRFGGSGNLSIDSSKYKFASGTFAGSGSLSITYAIVKYGEARFDGSSDLSIGTISRQQASAIFSGQGFMRSRIVGGRGPRLPTRTGIAGEPSDARSPETQTMRRLKEIA